LNFQADLVKTLVRAGKTLLDHGAVIEGVESQLGSRICHTNGLQSRLMNPFFLFRTHMSTKARDTTKSIFTHDLDMVHVAVVPVTTPKPEKCNLEEILKPPAKRSVTSVEGQKMGHFTRQMIYKRTEKEWKSIPKSWAIAPQRP
ncbi:hypothetical protein COOONC_06752, partial [Cooperia oncophora]